MAGKRLLLIGLDAGDAQLIERWCREGWLPNLARMTAEGTSCRLRTTAEVFHVSAWPSMFTGTAPDQHGLYHAYVTRPGHQGVLRPKPDQSPYPFVWKLLSDSGLPSVVMDAFLTCPLNDFKGAQIVDWGTWSWFWTPTIQPPALQQEFRRRFGAYPSDDHSKVGMTPVTDIAGFRQRLLQAVERKTEAVKWLMTSQDWNLFLVVFGECHPAGHYFWHLHDPSYLTHPAEGAGGLAHALRDVYVALDAAIGALIEAAGDEVTVWVTSGDGMAPNYSGSHLLPQLLTQMGELQRSGDEHTPAGAGGSAQKRDLLKTVRDLVPQRLRLAISSALLSRHAQEQLALRWKTAGIAWPATRAFVIENANEGYIRVNLKGREPQGSVAPGDEYASLVDSLYRAAVALVNPETGRSCIRAVYKTDALFDGPFRSHMPDLIICWDPDARVTTKLLAGAHGLVQVPQPSCGTAPFYSGNHWPNAFAIARGPGVPRGLQLDDRDILDIAPTLLRVFGVPQPPHMKGTAVTQLGGG